jgi:catechol 2,3-dioxygenase-like lactoylglutathione lyase family enzyme
MWISSVTISAPNPRELADFYQRLLGWTPSALEDGWCQLRAPEDQRGLMTINVEYDAAYVRPTWPSEPGKQHITVHLDIPAEDLPGAEARALEAGATLAEFQPQKHVRVMLDPAGHPFCLFQI